MNRFLFLFVLFLMAGVVMTGCSDNDMKQYNRMDSLQYNPYGDVFDKPGGSFTGLTMKPCYKNWKIFGGVIPQ